MPRIRSLKPEFWDSPSTARASLAARLLFLAMWNWADDSGRGTAGMKELEAFAFPNDDIRQYARNIAGNSAPTAGTSPELYRSFAELCGDVAEAYGVVFYRVKSRPYYVIPSFKTHQSKDFRATSKYPLESEGEIFDVTSGNTIHNPTAPGTSAPSAGNSAPTPGNSALVIGEQGKRGTGEEGIPAPAATTKPGQTGTRIPANFTMDTNMHAWALQHAPNVDAKTSTQKFKAHYRSISGPSQFKTDWTAAWEAWMLGDQQRINQGGHLTSSERRLQHAAKVAQRAANRQPLANPFEGRELEQ